MKFIVFGLGNFGASLAHQLVDLGHEVIGVDAKMELADKYKHSITHTVALDSTSKEAVEQLPIRDLDAAIVGIGENEGATIMTTALLKQMNVKRIICRVTSPLQKIVLEAMNIQEFVYPEAASAERLALKLDLPGVIDSFQINVNYRLLEVAVPDRYVGRSVADLNLAERYRLVLVTIIKNVKQKNIFGNDKNELQVMGIVPTETVVKSGDILLLFGAPKDLETFIEL
ncbi:MAG TPA: TrkA family potassium uptake protein [Flavisolibacter sp.]|jgi:trk system potassium uptake protein TrkA|nr:TrkA family potassium uptake protein [Flavisolibacter sp.]HZH99607.1 TrkA family potassium uptake protein [Flavisolibacter sp.]